MFGIYLAVGVRLATDWDTIDFFNLEPDLAAGFSPPVDGLLGLFSLAISNML